MKIAVMMRAMDQDSGFRYFVEGLVDSMLRIDRRNSYLLLYRDSRFLGRFSSRENAREIFLEAPHKFLWDQVAVPYAAWREHADIIFNPKFSVPLLSHCPVAMGLQEPAWWTWPQHYEWLDRHYERSMLPMYCRKAAHIFPMSNFDLEESRKSMGLPLKNVTVTWAAPGAHIREIDDASLLEQIRKRYALPDQFIFSATRVLHVGLDRSASYYPGKNPETTVRAFLLCRDEIPHRLVFTGQRVREYLLRAGFRDDDLRGVQFLERVPAEDLAGLYSLAGLFVIPSHYEGFGLSLLEAMTCGCPVVASRTGALPEISGGAALLADPTDPADFANQIRRAARDESLRNELRTKGRERAAFFSWEKTAGSTILGLEEAVQQQHRKKTFRKSHWVFRSI
jgi:glycosyltransferase involved in cell wall biosynthesis